MIAAFYLLAGCDNIAPVASTPTPARVFSAPTLRPSPTVMILPPTEIPVDSTGPGRNDPTAAALPAQGNLPPMAAGTFDATRGKQTVQITLGEGRVLLADLYENLPVQTEQGPLDVRLPGVLLIGAAPDAWGDLPAQIRDAGFTVLVAELMGGETTDDFSAVMQTFSEAGTVYPALMGVVGASSGADLALIGCAVEPLCDAAVLLSPIDGNTLSNVIADYNPRPLLIAASSTDTTSYNAAQTLQQAALGEVAFRSYDNAGHGVELVRNQPELVEIVAEWLGNWLAE